jgi:hypothetical protein
MQLYKQCFNCIEKQHPKLSKDQVHNVMKVIYDEVYSGGNSIVLHYQYLIRNQVFTQGAGVMEMHLVLDRVRSEKEIKKDCREKGVC